MMQPITNHGERTLLQASVLHDQVCKKNNNNHNNQLELDLHEHATMLSGWDVTSRPLPIR